MVNNITSLTGNGLKDWLIQRVTAVYFSVYILFLLSFLFCHSALNYNLWSGLFHNNGFKISSVLALIALSLHAWIGIWTVTTDYIKHTLMRLILQLLVVAYLLGQFIFGLIIVWGQ